MSVSTQSATVFECLHKSCAPPPVGTGGSLLTSKAAVSALKARLAKKGSTVKKAPAKKGAVDSSRPPAGTGGTSGSLFPETREFVPVYKQDGIYRKVIGNAVSALRKSNPKAAKVVAQYVEDGYIPMNKVLRNPKWSPTGVSLGYAGVKDRKGLDESIKTMRAAFNDASTLKQPTLLYRAVDMKMKLKAGDVITDKGFVSTSLFMDRATHTVAEIGDSAATVFRIAAPTGTKFLAGEKREQELILAPDSSFRVAKSWTYRVAGQQITVYDVELV